MLRYVMNVVGMGFKLLRMETVQSDRRLGTQGKEVVSFRQRREIDREGVNDQ